jgi:hypothetical protein
MLSYFTESEIMNELITKEQKKMLNKFYDRLKKERCIESDSVSFDDVDMIYDNLLRGKP